MLENKKKQGLNGMGNKKHGGLCVVFFSGKLPLILI